MENIKIENLLDLERTIACDLFKKYVYPWEVLPYIKDFIIELGKNLSLDDYDNSSEFVWISKKAKVAPTAFIAPYTVICEGAEVRHCAYIRGSAIVGKNAVVGNSTELKNVILFDNVQVPHYNYVGDSILGYKSHMGAGSITSNVKSDKALVLINNNGEKIATNLKKIGAILGDNVEVGCNSVLNPGAVIGRNSNIYPLSSVRGVVPSNSIYKQSGDKIITKI